MSQRQRVVKPDDGSVDWVQIERQLNGIPADFKSQKFNSLKRVIEILSKDQPQFALQELQQELEVCEEIIDAVVDSHHLGFNHATENYSKILGLFNHCKHQVEALRTNFDEAHACLSTVSTNLRRQWYTSMALQSSLSILKDVQAVATDSETLQAKIAEGDFMASEPILLRLANRLSIEGLSKVGALSHVRSRLPDMYKSVVSCLVQDIVNLIFDRPLNLVAAGKGARAGRGEGMDADQAPVIHHTRVAAAVAAKQDYSADAEEGEALRELQLTQEGDARLQERLDALVHLDALQELRDAIVTNLSSHVNTALERAIDAAHTPEGTDVLPGMLAPSRRTLLPAVAHIRVSSILLSTLVNLLFLFRNVLDALDRMGRSGPALAAARRVDGRAVQGLLKQDAGAAPADADMSHLTAAAVADREVVWGMLQQEVVSVLGCLIRAPVAQTTAAQVGSMAARAALVAAPPSSSDWLSNLLRPDAANVVARPKRATNLEFQFASTATAAKPREAAGTAGTGSGSHPSSPSAAAAGADGGAGGQPGRTAQEGKDLAERVLQRVVPPTPFLLPSLYTPLWRFVEAALRMLGQEFDGHVGASRGSLQQFMDGFVAETLLPKVMQEAKAQALSALEQKSAFAPSTVTADGDGAGTYVLQAAHKFASLEWELSAWAANMPMYAEQLCGVASTVGVILDERVTDMLAKALKESAGFTIMLDKPSVQESLAAELTMNFVADMQLFPPQQADSNSGNLKQSKGKDSLLWEVLEAQGQDVELPSPAAVAKLMVRLASIASTLMHMAQVLEDVGTCFATPQNTADKSAEAGSGAARGQPNPSAGPVRGPGNSAGSPSSGRKLLPELQGLLQTLSLPTRMHTTVAVAFVRALPHEGKELPTNIAHMITRMRHRAGRCLAAMRLQALLGTAEGIASVFQGRNHNVTGDAGRERDPGLQQLARAQLRLREDVRPYLPERCLHYVFSDAARVAYRLLMWNLPRVESINNSGVERVGQWVQLLKAALAPLAPNKRARSAEERAAHAAMEDAFNATHLFVRLLQGPVTNVLMEANKPSSRRRMSQVDWLTLLDVPVHGRPVTKMQRTQLKQALDNEAVSPETAVA